MYIRRRYHGHNSNGDDSEFAAFDWTINVVLLLLLVLACFCAYRRERQTEALLNGSHEDAARAGVPSHLIASRKEFDGKIDQAKARFLAQVGLVGPPVPSVPPGAAPATNATMKAMAATPSLTTAVPQLPIRFIVDRQTPASHRYNAVKEATPPPVLPNGRAISSWATSLELNYYLVFAKDNSISNNTGSFGESTLVDHCYTIRGLGQPVPAMAYRVHQSTILQGQLDIVTGHAWWLEQHEVLYTEPESTAVQFRVLVQGCFVDPSTLGTFSGTYEGWEYDGRNGRVIKTVGRMQRFELATDM